LQRILVTGKGGQLATGLEAALPARGFAFVNLALVIAWFAIAWQVGRLYQVRTAASAAPKPAVA